MTDVYELLASSDEEFDALPGAKLVRHNPARRRRASVLELPRGEFKSSRVKLAVVRDPDFDSGLRTTIGSAEDVYALMKDAAEVEPVECMWAVILDSKLRVMGVYEAVRGQVSQVTVEPADLLRAVLVMGSTRYIAVHNHPSSEPEPSSDDIRLTERLVTSAKCVGVQLHDHIIIGHPRFASLALRGLIPG